MEQVVVTATRNAKLLKNTPDITLVQNFDETQAMGSYQIDDIVEYMPGASSIGGTGSGMPFKRTLSINGMPADYGLILLDGKRVLSSHIHTGANVNILPPEHIERVELVKGAMSAQYGTDGIGGILNIITKKGTDNTNFSFNSYGGSQNTFHSGLSLTGSLNGNIKHSFFSSWDRSNGDPIIKPVFRKGKLAYTKFNLMHQIDANISDALRAGASINYMNIETPYGEDPKAATYFTPGLDLKYRISKDITLHSSSYYSRWKSQKNNELNEIMSPNLIFNYSGFKNHDLLIGSEIIYRNFTRKRVSEHDQYLYGAFIQDEITISPIWDVLVAVRLDKVEDINYVISPKISVLSHINERITWRSSIGRGFRAPTVQDLYETLYSHPGNIHFRAGNQNFKPEYSTTLMSGLDWKVKENSSLMFNGYYYSIDNMITPIDHGLEDPTKYFSESQIPFINDSLVYIYRRENIHQGMILGGELKLHWQFLPNYLINCGFSLSHNENKDTGKSLPYYPGQSLTLKLQGHETISEKFAINGFVGLIATMDRKVWRFKHDGEQQIELKNYQKLNAGIDLVFDNNYELFLNVENIMGQRIHLYEDLDFIIEGVPIWRLGLRIYT